MKNLKNFMPLAFFLLMATFLVSCQSNADKIENASEDVVDAQEDLRDAQQEAVSDANRAASDEEWKMFRSEHEVVVRDNDTRLKDLRIKMKSNNSAADKAYLTRLEALEQRNRDLNNRFDNYENNQGDWEAFKREFKHDMDAIGEGFKELGVNNKG